MARTRHRFLLKKFEMPLPIDPGSPFRSLSPATGEVAWEGTSATLQQVNHAVENARRAWQDWRQTTVDERCEIVKRFATVAKQRQPELASLISKETGKPHWESKAEAGLIASKVDWSIKSYHSRCTDPAVDLPQGTGRVRWESIGVMAVLGPFNFPAHLPNGHLVPALIAGNVAIFKPSELTPGCGALLAELLE